MGSFPRDVWLQLSGHELRLIEELAYRTKHTEWALLPRAFLAQRLKVSVRQITRMTTHLQDLGILRKFQRKYRRKDGTYETHPCLYRLFPWIKWKMRQLLGWIAGRPISAHTFTGSEKITPLDLSFVQNEGRRAALERFGNLGKPRRA